MFVVRSLATIGDRTRRGSRETMIEQNTCARAEEGERCSLLHRRADNTLRRGASVSAPDISVRSRDGQRDRLRPAGVSHRGD